MRLRRWLIGLTLIVAVIFGALIAVLSVTPTTTGWPRYLSGTGLSEDNALAITWLGTSSLLISDGKTALLTDGYFSRVSRIQTISANLSPNHQRITTTSAALDLSKLAAIMVVHSHFDHVMDAPWIALDTGADLIGSESTANVGRGAGLPEDQIKVPVNGEALRYGKFEVFFLPSAHVPQSKWIDELTGMHQDITVPLTPPAPVQAWKEGGSYTLLIRHPYGDVLIQGSAGFEEGQLEGYTADIALVSSVGLYRQPLGYSEDYVRNTAGTTGAKIVVPIHWDDFFTELTPHTKPLPSVMEDLNASFTLLAQALEPYDANLFVLDPMRTLYFRREQ